jgi:hypothetical protein
MIFGKKKKPEPRVWHNPDPKTIGEVVIERLSQDGTRKGTIIRNRQGTFTIYLYHFDDSDLKEGWTNAVGWLGTTGPTITDSLERAEQIVMLELGNGQKET